MKEEEEDDRFGDEPRRRCRLRHRFRRFVVSLLTPEENACVMVCMLLLL